MDDTAFLSGILQNNVNRTILGRLPALGLPDAWLTAGCLFQTVWNMHTGRPPEEGIKDYDLFYFDGGDLSWEAEDREIRRVTAALGDLAAEVELKNQARVHLWYAERFGSAYPQLRCSRDGIDRYLVDCTRVGVHAGAGGAMEVYAPSGFEDLHRGILRPNPLSPSPERFRAKAESYRERWPWLRIEA
jgi:uncharacterized protein